MAPNSPGSSRKHTWSAQKAAPKKSHRVVNLIVVSALFFAACFWFATLLWNYQKAPDTYLLYLQIANRDSADVYPLVTVSEDAINQFGTSLGAKQVVSITPPDATQGDRATEVAIQNAIRERLPDLKSNDVVVLYLRGYCVVRQNRPFLVAANFAPIELANANTTAGLVDLLKLFADLEQLTASNVIVLLDHADLDVTNPIQLSLESDSRKIVEQLANGNSTPSQPSNKKSTLLIVAAKSDFQPSHISLKTNTESKSASTVFFFALQRAINELQKDPSTSRDGVLFSDFVEQAQRYVTLGTASLQTPVLLTPGRKLEINSSDTTLAFRFGKSTTKSTELSKPTDSSNSAATSKPPANEEQDPSSSESESQTFIANVESRWKSIEPMFTSQTGIWPTDFAPFSWHSQLERLKRSEFEFLSGSGSGTLPEELSAFVDPVAGPSSSLFGSAAEAWRKMTNHPHCRAWLFDVSPLPARCPTFPYRPAPTLAFERSKQLAREIARDGNHLGSWLRLLCAYPDDGSSSASEYLEAIRLHVNLLLEADELWQQLADNPDSITLDAKNKLLNQLNESRTRLFQGTQNPSFTDIEIERLITNADLTIWQTHYRAGLLLRFAQLTTKQRSLLLRHCQSTPLKPLPQSNIQAPERTLENNLGKTEAVIQRLLERNAGILRPSLTQDVLCITRPTLSQQLEFYSAEPNNNSNATLTLLRTLTAQPATFVVQRRDGSSPPTELLAQLKGASTDILTVQQAGRKVDWNKPLPVRLQNGTLSFELAAQQETNPNLPASLDMELSELEATQPALQKRLAIEWPMKNAFELYAVRAGTTQKFDISIGDSLLGAALMDSENQPLKLNYQLFLHNRSRLARKANVQIYRVVDPRRSITIPGTIFDANRQPVWSPDELASQVGSWQKIMPQELLVSADADRAVSLSALIAARPKPTTPVAPPTTEATSFDVPAGLVCEVKELDENEKAKGPQYTTYIWIPFDTLDPFASKQALRCLNIVPPFVVNENRKLVLNLEATDNLRSLPKIGKIPIQIEFQSREQSGFEKGPTLALDVTQPISRELPLTSIGDELFLAHISFGTFPRQASYVFQNSQDQQPKREPEVHAHFNSIEVTRAVTAPAAATGTTDKPPAPLLVRIPDSELSQGGKWALLNSQDELRNKRFTTRIEAVLPAQQGFVGWRIYDQTRDQSQQLIAHYEQVDRKFFVRLDSDGTLELTHSVQPLTVDFDAENLFDQPGVYQLQVYSNEWRNSQFVTVRDLQELTPSQSETILVDRTPAEPITITLANSLAKNLAFNANLNRGETYQVTLILPTADVEGVPIKDVFFGIDSNDDGEFQENEAIKEPQITRVDNAINLTYKVPMEQINPIRFVAKTIDYAGNSQPRNKSDRYAVNRDGAMTAGPKTSKPKLYSLTITVLNTVGSTPSTEVELKMEGKEYTSRIAANQFVYKNLPAGSYQVTATTTAGTSQYETSQKIDVSGDNSNLNREIRLKRKETPPKK
jgi:hypothetical protein